MARLSIASILVLLGVSAAAPRYLRTSTPVKSAVADAPQQVHLAYGTPAWASTAVSWLTNNLTLTSMVRYGPSATNLSQTAVGAPATAYLYTFNHHVILTGLSSKATYFYQCGDDAAGWSAVFTFVSGAAPGSEFPYTVALFADMGNYNSEATFGDLARIMDSVDAIVQPGDISYADDAFLHDPLVFGYETAWDTYMSNMSAVGATNKHWMVCPGNHEAECHSPICFVEPARRVPLANFSAYNNRFHMPSVGSNGTMNMWHSWEYGTIHFTMINTETDFKGAPLDEYSSKNGGFGDQMAWLQADLADAAARRATGEVSWIIALGHRPVYSIDSADGTTNAPTGDALALQAAVEPLFAQYGVDMYVAGHVHGTEVQWPVHANTNVTKSFDNPPHTTYLIVGAAGCDEGLTDYSGAPRTVWNSFADGDNYGLTVLTFVDANTLTWEFRKATDGSTVTNITLVRQH